MRKRVKVHTGDQFLIFDLASEWHQGGGCPPNHETRSKEPGGRSSGRNQIRGERISKNFSLLSGNVRSLNAKSGAKKPLIRF